MAIDDHHFELTISEFLFRLTTETLRVRSNEILQCQTVGELVEHLLASSGTDGAQSEVALIRDHLQTIPSHGHVLLPIALGRDAAGRLREMRRSLSAKLDSPVSEADAISILMFEYLSAKKAISLLQKLGIISDRAPH